MMKCVKRKAKSDAIFHTPKRALTALALGDAAHGSAEQPKKKKKKKKN